MKHAPRVVAEHPSVCGELKCCHRALMHIFEPLQSAVVKRHRSRHRGPTPRGPTPQSLKHGRRGTGGRPPVRWFVIYGCTAPFFPTWRPPRGARGSAGAPHTDGLSRVCAWFNSIYNSHGRFKGAIRSTTVPTEIISGERNQASPTGDRPRGQHSSHAGAR